MSLNSSSHIVKGVNSIEYLLEETISHLHINHKDLAPEKRRIIENIRNKEDILTGKNILIVDDDVRNLFALTTVFEQICAGNIRQCVIKDYTIEFLFVYQVNCFFPRRRNCYCQLFRPGGSWRSAMNQSHYPRL